MSRSFNLLSLGALASLVFAASANAQGYYPYPQPAVPYYGQYVYPQYAYPYYAYPAQQPQAEIQQTGAYHTDHYSATPPGQKCIDCGCSGPFGCHKLIDGYRANQVKACLANMHATIASHFTLPPKAPHGRHPHGPLVIDQFPMHPYAHGPRDFFMFYENLEAERSRDLRPTIVP